VTVARQQKNKIVVRTLQDETFACWNKVRAPDLYASTH